MKAMVFAAGLGTRLRAVSGDRPKCLVDIGGITLLEHVLSRLKSAGVSTVVINLHYQGEMIEAFLEERGNLGLEIVFSKEKDLLDTGGGLSFARSNFEGEDFFLVHNSDVYSEIDLNKLIELHKLHSPIATLAVRSKPSERALLLDKKSLLVGWDRGPDKGVIMVREEPEAKRVNLTGIHVVSPKIFDHMDNSSRPYSIVESYIQASKMNNQILGHDVGDSLWMDVGTPEKLEAVRNHCRK